MAQDRVEVPGVSIAVRGFDVVETIGSGGFSRVYRAVQPDLGRDVALKVLNLDLETRAERSAFERECRAMGALAHHPSIVSVFASTFAEDGRPCIVMEYFSEGTFGDRLKREGALDIATVLRAGVELAGALQTAHDHGVVHRDIKPSNLFISPFGTGVLGDFGISSFEEERTITGGGGLTVYYAPPELIEGEPASAASDVYSLAASLFTLLAGDKPFPKGPGQTTADLARRILVEPAPRLAVAGSPASVSDLLSQSMAKDPELRPASAGAFGQRLQHVQVELGFIVTPLIAAGFEDRVSGGPSGHVARAGHAGAVSRLDEAVAGSWSGNRRLTAAALGGLAVIALGSTAVAVGRGGAANDTTSSTGSSSASIAAIDSFFVAPPVPTGMSVVSDAEGRIRVSWSPDQTGVVVGYQVEMVGANEVLETADTHVDLDPLDRSSNCFVVRSVGEGGRLSGDADPVCLGER